MGGRGASGVSRSGMASAKSAGVTASQQDAIDNYVGSATTINEYLRGNSKPNASAKRYYDKQVKRLDEVTNSGRLGGQTLYRGVQHDVDAEVGKTITIDKAFASTTTDSESPFLSNRPVNFVIRTKAGQRGHDMSKTSRLRENEVLLPRGSHLKVTRVVKRGGKTIVYGDLVQ